MSSGGAIVEELAHTATAQYRCHYWPACIRPNVWEDHKVTPRNLPEPAHAADEPNVAADARTVGQ